MIDHVKPPTFMIEALLSDGSEVAPGTIDPPPGMEEKVAPANVLVTLTEGIPYIRMYYTMSPGEAKKAFREGAVLELAIMGTTMPPVSLMLRNPRDFKDIPNDKESGSHS